MTDWRKDVEDVRQFVFHPLSGNPGKAQDALDSLQAAYEAMERERDSEKALRIEVARLGEDVVARLEAAERERDALQHIIDCADTPLMRNVLRERDEALNAEEVAEQYREKAEARVAELEKQMAEGSATP